MEHPGFEAVQERIAKQKNKRGKGKIGMKRSGAILAAGARKASESAVKANPRLKRVRGRLL